MRPGEAAVLPDLDDTHHEDALATVEAQIAASRLSPPPDSEQFNPYVSFDEI